MPREAADLNELYSASLEFGGDWRRPLAALAAERLPLIANDSRSQLVKVVAGCRDAIEERVRKDYEFVAGAWGSAETDAVRSWIAAKYPWMSGENIGRAISQGVYYAWHG